MPTQITTITATVNTFTPVAYKGVPVMTTEMLAQAFGTEVKNIQMNYTNNKDRFAEGAHFFKVTGKALDDLRPKIFGSQISSKARSLILWTEKGAARHAKSLNTDEAWSVYEQLEDTYFAVKEGRIGGTEQAPKPASPELAAAFAQMVLEHLPSLGERSKQALLSEASVSVFGVRTVPLPAITERFWTTTEIANEVGVSPITAGKTAEFFGLKTKELGEARLSKSRYSDKQVSQWHWNAEGREMLLSVLTPGRA